MAIRNQNWYNLQATRRYPLDDKSTGDDDGGAPIRDDIIVDCHIRFPRTLGAYAYVQGITVSPTLVTLVIGAVETLDSTTTTTIAAVNLPKPVDDGVNYAIQPLQAGVSGWITFGRGVDTPFSGRYSTPRQSFIGLRNARPYTPLPVPTLGKLGLNEALAGIVNIVADTPMTATYYENYTLPKYDPETDTTNTQPVKAIIFSCVSPTADFNPYSYFLGPCGQRPESGTCPKTPIETINGVAPDCETGNINVVVSGGLTARPFLECGGLDITTPLGLADACATVPPGDKRRRDICCPSEDGESEFCWPDVTTPAETPQAMVEYPTLPVQITPTAAGTVFEIRTGVFSAAHDGDRQTYQAQSPTNWNIALTGPYPSDWAVDHAVSAEFKIEKTGLRQNAGVLLNYVNVRDNGKQKAKYVLALYDADTGELQIHRHDGNLLIQESQMPVRTNPQHWHRLAVTAELKDTGEITITAALRDITENKDILTLQTHISDYEIVGGYSGVATNASQTHFGDFDIQ